MFFYQLLEVKFGHDQVKINHWFRHDHKELKKSPFYAIVGYGQLEDVIDLLS